MFVRLCGVLIFLFLSVAIANAALPEIEAGLMNKNYEEVRAMATKVMNETQDPLQRTEAQYYLGLGQLRLGQYAQAREAFEAVLQQSRSTDLYDKAGLGLIEGLYMAGFYKDAIKKGGSLLRHSPNSQSKSLIYLKMARAHLKLMQWQKAKEFLQKIIDEFPQSFEAPIAKGLLEEKEYFAVQVGSFIDQSRALKLMEELKSGGQYAYIVEITTLDGMKFYRVRVGQMTSLSDAQALESELERLGYPTRIYP